MDKVGKFTASSLTDHEPDLAFVIGTCVALLPVASRAAPISIILDTDMGPDCDDVGALFVLHGAVEREQVKLLATIGCTSSPFIGPCIDASTLGSVGPRFR